MTDGPRESSFDALASGLASGSISRGKALKLMGAALVGGLLASTPGIAQAASPCQICKDNGLPCCKISPGRYRCCAANEVCCRFRDPITGQH